MKASQAHIDLLDSIGDGDPEAAHGLGDKILMVYAPREIQEAYERMVARQSWWATA